MQVQVYCNRATSMCRVVEAVSGRLRLLLTVFSLQLRQSPKFLQLFNHQSLYFRSLETGILPSCLYHVVQTFFNGLPTIKAVSRLWRPFPDNYIAFHYTTQKWIICSQNFTKRYRNESVIYSWVKWLSSPLKCSLHKTLRSVRGGASVTEPVKGTSCLVVRLGEWWYTRYDTTVSSDHRQPNHGRHHFLSHCIWDRSLSFLLPLCCWIQTRRKNLPRSVVLSNSCFICLCCPRFFLLILFILLSLCFLSFSSNSLLPFQLLFLCLLSYSLSSLVTFLCFFINLLLSFAI